MENVTFADILTRYAMQEIDDINWTSELVTSPARFLRAKSDTVANAIPLFSRPPEMRKYLEYTPPAYDDYSYTAPGDTSAPTTISTGKTGFEICSAVRYKQVCGSTELEALTASYNAETGAVTIAENLKQGDEIDIDFYTDAVFHNDLNDSECHILGLCVALKWFSRFANTWLNITPKISDKTFGIGSESSQMTSNTNRLKELRNQLNDDLLRYEQNIAYDNVMTGSSRMRLR